ncbi:MAG: TraB/GumN family protein [Defluviitaleaceae bacterium]|nr:TraB/GumN family protein [Defluviitaleaceae bacterium]
MKQSKIVLSAIMLVITLALLVGCSRSGQGEDVQDYPYDIEEHESDQLEEVEEYIPEQPEDIVADSQENPSEITPLLWLVTSPTGQTMYLFGSIHAGDASIYPLPPYIMDAFNRSSYLAIEADVLAFERNFEAQIALTLGMMYQDGRTIVDDIGEDLHQAISQMFEEHGLPPAMFDGFKPFLWYQTLLSIALEASGLMAEYGLDMYFLHVAESRGMDIIEMESLEMQTEIFNDFSLPLHIFMIENSMDIPLMAEGIALLYDAWQRGNKQELLEIINADYDDMPDELWEEFNNALFIQRDIDMTAKARELMAEGRDVFFVAGLGHFIGDGSIVYLLRQYGYTVEVVSPRG